MNAGNSCFYCESESVNHLSKLEEKTGLLRDAEGTTDTLDLIS